MVRQIYLGLLIACPLALLYCAPASAEHFISARSTASATDGEESIRLPQSGDPAYAFTLPAGWTSKYGPDGTLTITAGACSCAVVLAIGYTDTVTTPTSEMAATVFTAAGASPYSSMAPAAIAGIPGDGYFSTLLMNGMLLGLKLAVVRVDPLHYAELMVITRPNPSPAATSALDALLAAVRLTVPH
jgi:hypothetical protein